jgi:hypothetical protein
MFRASAAGIATDYGLDERGIGVRVPVETRIFTSLCSPDRLWAPTRLYPMGTGGSFSWLKRLGREADHSRPTNAEVFMA